MSEGSQLNHMLWMNLYGMSGARLKMLKEMDILGSTHISQNIKEVTLIYSKNTFYLLLVD